MPASISTKAAAREIAPCKLRLPPEIDIWRNRHEGIGVTGAMVTEYG
jgi:hypothetical protein